MENYRKYKCSDIKDPDLIDYVDKCNGESKELSGWNFAVECGKQGLGIWGEALSALQKSPQMIVSELGRSLQKKAQPSIDLHKWQQNCRKRKQCIANLIQASQRKKIPKKELNKKAQEVLDSWRSNQAFMFYYNRAANLNSFGGHRDPWYSQEMKRTLGRHFKKRKPQPHFFQRVSNEIESRYGRYQCLNSSGKSIMRCYVAFSLLDPTLAAGLIAKGPKLAKLVKEMGKETHQKVQKQLLKRKKLSQLSDEQFDNKMMELKTPEQRHNFISNLSDQELKDFYERTSRGDVFGDHLYIHKKWDELRSKLIRPEASRDTFDTISRRYYARLNKRNKVGPPVNARFKTIPKGKEDRLEFIDQAGRRRGYVEYSYYKNPGQLEIKMRAIDDVRDSGRGIQGVLFDELLKKFPNTRSIDSVFIRSNQAAVNNGLRAGLSCVEAIKRTPAYRLAAKRGFTIVTTEFCESGMGATFKKP